MIERDFSDRPEQRDQQARPHDPIARFGVIAAAGDGSGGLGVGGRAPGGRRGPTARATQAMTELQVPALGPLHDEDLVDVSDEQLHALFANMVVRDEEVVGMPGSSYCRSGALGHASGEGVVRVSIEVGLGGSVRLCCRECRSMSEAGRVADAVMVDADQAGGEAEAAPPIPERES
eukprot:scaffold6.g2873.t1